MNTQLLQKGTAVVRTRDPLCHSQPSFGALDSHTGPKPITSCLPNTDKVLRVPRTPDTL